MSNTPSQNFPDQFQFGTAQHHAWLRAQAVSQFAFFKASLRPDKGFFTLGYDGKPLESSVQELHTTTRLVHSYGVGKLAGITKCDSIIDQGMAYLWDHHRDAEHGGYLWALDDQGIHDDRKLAYGHVFVLLAGSTAKLAGHPDAGRLIDDATAVLDTHFWEEDAGLFADEWARDWTPFSTYRGMNANMHGVEALLAAFEATGREIYLERAGRILSFFVSGIAASEGWRMPEHYTQDWVIDRAYAGDPMFRPAGTTPGHSVEWARLLLQHWDLAGRPDTQAVDMAWRLSERALIDAWDPKNGGMAYTLKFDGTPDMTAHYWWPVCEAIGVLASLLKLGGTPDQAQWYSRLWAFADANFIDHAVGGWFPEVDTTGAPVTTVFDGKPDIYHAMQATVFPMTEALSHMAVNLKGSLAP